MAKQITIPYSEFRERVDEVIESVIESDDIVVIEIDGQPSVVLRAVARDLDAPLRRGKRTPEAFEAFRRSAGAWRDVDTERLLADIYTRRASFRPPVDL